MNLEDFNKSLTRTKIRNMIAENFRYRREACSYLLQEVIYTKEMCTVSNHLKYKYFQNLKIQAENLEKALVSICDQIDSIFQEWYNIKSEDKNYREGKWFNNTFITMLNWIDNSISSLSGTMQDISNSLIHRRFRNASSSSIFLPAFNSPRMRLSEVHIDYADTFRGITSLAQDYFYSTKDKYFPSNKYKDREISSPVIVVSRGENFCWRPFYDLKQIPVFIQGEKAFSYMIKNDSLDDLYNNQIIDNALAITNCLKDYTEYMINFSKVEAPRYFPVMIRYSSLLAHELFHPIIRVAELIFESNFGFDDQLLKKNYFKRSDFKKVNKVEKDFGKSMSDLVFARANLQTNICDFLLNLYCLKNNTRTKKYNQGFEAYIKPNYCKNDIDSDYNLSMKEQIWDDTIKDYDPRFFERKAKKFANELIADICGLIVAQQSYIYALICMGINDNASILTFDKNPRVIDRRFPVTNHPPLIVRVNILLEIAKEMGLKETVKKAQRLIEGFQKDSVFYELNSNIWEIWKENWWLKDDTQACYKDIIRNICGSTDYSHIYEACSTKGQYNIPQFNENWLSKIFRVLADRIDNNKIYWDDMLGLKEIIEKEIYKDNKDEIKFENPGKFRLMASDIINALWFKTLDNKKEDCERQRLQWRLALAKSQGNVYAQENKKKG
ncbi:MAG: hypothetical protein GY839_02055 [candidate division Zixibacteria bacterium]|nr:hypothetical protein [candidate division Zixibacteria bacterium]